MRTQLALLLLIHTSVHSAQPLRQLVARCLRFPAHTYLAGGICPFSLLLSRLSLLQTYHLQFNLATFAFDSQLVLEAPLGNLNTAVMDSRGVILYFGAGSETSVASIIAVDVSGLVRPTPRFFGAVIVSPMLLITAAGDPDANIAYFGSYMAPQMALRWDMTMTLTLSDRPRVQTLPFIQGAGEGLLRAAAAYNPPAASASGLLATPPAVGVFGTCASPAIVFRVDLQRMIRLDTVTLPSLEDYLAAVAVVTDPTGASFPRAFFVTDRAGVGGEPGPLPQERLVEVQLGPLLSLAASSSGLRRMSSLLLPAAARSGVFVLWHSDSSTLLVGTAASPGLVLRVSIGAGNSGSGATLVSNFTLDPSMGTGAGPGQHVLSAGVMDAGQDILFIATSTSPSRILALSLRSDPMTPLGPAQGALAPWTRCLAVSAATSQLFAGSGTLTGVVSAYATSGVLDGNSVEPLTSTALLAVPAGTSARVAVVDEELGYIYVATDGDPPSLIQMSAADLTIVSRFDMEADTQRPSALLLVPQVGVATGDANIAEPALIMATDSVPGFMHLFHPTPRMPRLITVEPGIAQNGTRLRPPPGVCSGIASKLAVLSETLVPQACGYMPRLGVLGITGSLFGLFLPPDSFAVPTRLSISVAQTHILSLLEDGSWVADDLGTDLGVAAELTECSSVFCSDGSTCACRLDMLSMASALATHMRSILAANRPVPVLRAMRVSLVAQRDGRASPPYALALVAGAPQILSVSPAVIAKHDVSLRVETALLLPFDPAAHHFVLEQLVQTASNASLVGLSRNAATFPCQLGTAAITGDTQSFDCTPPPLSPAVAGQSFRLSLRNASGFILAQLRSPVRYAWPVIAGVTAADPGQAAFRFGRRLRVQAPAMALGTASCNSATGSATGSGSGVAGSGGVSGAASALVRVWVASSPCVNVSVLDACRGFIECSAPSGVGLRVPLRVEVQLQGQAQGASGSVGAVLSSSGFNVTSFEQLAETGRGDAVATYDGSGDVGELPNPPRIGAVSVIDYDTPVIDAVAPANLAVRPRPSSSPTPRVELRVSGSAFPVPPVELTLGLRAVAAAAVSGPSLVSCAAAVSPDGQSASCWLSLEDVESAAMQVSTQAAPRAAGVNPLAGAAVLAVQLTASVPGWPSHTATSVTSSAFMRVTGLPLITSVRPVSGRAGTVLDIEGAALSSGSGPVTVTIGAALCGNVTRVSDSLLRCIVPPFVDAAAASGASTADFALVVRTDAGASAAATFRYSDELYIAWSPPDPPAGSSSGSAGSVPSSAFTSAAAANVSFIGLSPLRPIPAVTLERGTFAQCTLALAEQQPGAPATASSIRLSGTLTMSVPAGSPAGTLVAFPDARLTSTVLAPFTAALVVRCREAAGNAEPASTARLWPVAAPVPRWSNATVDALRLRAVFAPLDADTPLLLLDVQTQLPASASATAIAASGALFADGAVLSALSSGLTCLASIANAGASVPLLADIPGIMMMSSSSSAGISPSGGATAAAIPGSAAAAASMRFAFPRATLAVAPLASSVSISAVCRFDSSSRDDSSGVIPTSSTPDLHLDIVAAAMTWEIPPPPLIESQAPIAPPPRLRLQLQGGASVGLLPSSAPLRCTVSAAPVSNITVSSSSTSAAGSGAAASATTDSVVVPQTVEGTWMSSLAFPAVAVNGRRRAHFEVTATCMLGSQPLPVLRASTEIRGCRAGQAPSGTNGWLCTDCPAGNYSLGGDMPCISCPAVGSECGTGVLVLRPGFFRPASQVGQPFTRDTELHACLVPEACTLNASTMVHGCDEASGYGGALCAVCQDGFAPSSGRKCSPCWSPAANALVLALLAAALVGAALYLAVYARPGNRSPASLAFRQAVTLLQSVSVIGAFRLQASALARSVLGWTDVSNTSLLNVGPLGCVLRLPFLARFLTTLLLPLAFGALVAAIAAAAEARARCRKPVPKAAQQAGAGTAASAASSPASAHIRGARPSHAAAAAAAASATSTEAAHARRPSAALQLQSVHNGHGRGHGHGHGQGRGQPRVPLRTRLLSVTLTLLSLLYMPLVTTCLQALTCYDKPVDGVSYLLADMSVVCGEGGHAIARGLAWTTLVLLGLGFPVAIVLLLARVGRVRPLSSAGARAGKARSQQQQQPSELDDLAAGSPVASNELLRTMRPLWDGYRRDLLAWEATTFLRKLLLALVGAFLAPRIAGIALFSLLLAIALFLQMAVAPFEEPRFNNGEAVSLACALVIGLLAMLYEGSDAADPANASVTAAIAIVLAVGLGFLLLQLIRVGTADAKQRLLRLASLCPWRQGRDCCTKLITAGACCGAAQTSGVSKAASGVGRGARMVGGNGNAGRRRGTGAFADQRLDADNDEAFDFDGANVAFAHDLPKLLRAASLGVGAGVGVGHTRRSAVAQGASKASPRISGFSSTASRSSFAAPAAQNALLALSVPGEDYHDAPPSSSSPLEDLRHVAAAAGASPGARRKLRMSLGVGSVVGVGVGTPAVLAAPAAVNSQEPATGPVAWTANPVAFADDAGGDVSARTSGARSGSFYATAATASAQHYRTSARASAAPMSFAALPTSPGTGTGTGAGAGAGSNSNAGGTARPGSRSVLRQQPAQAPAASSDPDKTETASSDQAGRKSIVSSAVASSGASSWPPASSSSSSAPGAPGVEQTRRASTTASSQDALYPALAASPLAFGAAPVPVGVQPTLAPTRKSMTPRLSAMPAPVAEDIEDDDDRW